ncbi:hypothetical protein PROFUN_13136 [Planoprotostelium fungivorum]|uniref:Fascin domain-containing protein n=1 Tax=Planoprotostelium fungivorum TaxID=1890364 RepID=A0A2P6N540_9EUKA|nr:hypothetical protein PROFUN_13136 [Planoprotostelium fungivorum]
MAQVAAFSPYSEGVPRQFQEFQGSLGPQSFEHIPFALRSWRGTFIGPLDNGGFQQSGRAGQSEHWRIIPVQGRPGNYFIRSWKNKFLCGDNNGNIQQRDVPKEWEEWTIAHRGNGKFNFRSVAFGTYLTVDHASIKLTANNKEAEQFEFVVDSTCAIFA